MSPPSSNPATDPHSLPPRGDDVFLARLREWFDLAIDVSPEQRQAWIAAHISDPEERVALARLLDSDAESSGFFETPASQHVAEFVDDESDDLIAMEGLLGTRVGVFRLVRLLGKGGMAAVFLGEREGGDFRQRAAVKLLRRGLYSEIEQRLFQRERRVLASLTHPNIAHLIDGGLTEAGIPFLIMEYVDGVPVTRYAADRALGVRERIELIVTICRAVEAAHRSLIVHRDIKPSNILVMRDGTVKLLDFGIAKLIEDEDDAPTAAVFTPEYAAPEQRGGKAITTATDVYALGVLLYELLLGVRPGAEAMRRPSSQVGAAEAGAAPPRLLRRALRGDLDNVLLRALEAEPERRYASAGALADDIQRYLDGRPVDAHPPSPWYRTRKFVARHKGGVATTLAFLLALFSALGIALWQASVARREAARAEAEFRHASDQAKRAEHVKSFLVGLFSGLDPNVAPEKRPTLVDVFERGVAALRADASVESRLRVELLTIAGDVLFRSGERQRGLDVTGEAVALGESSLPADAEEYLKAIATLSDLDFIDSRVDTARERLLAALDRAGEGDSPARVSLLLELGLVERRKGDLAEAVRRLEQANAMRARAAIEADGTLGLLVETELAYAYYLSARFDEAARLQRALLERAEARYGDQHDTTTRVMGDFAETLSRTGRPREGLDLLKRSGNFYRRTQPAPNEAFAGWLYSIGLSFSQRGLWRPAERAFAESAATFGARFGLDDIQSLASRAGAAEARSRLGDAAVARTEMERVLAIQIAAQGQNHPRTLALRLMLGRILLQLDDAENAGAQAAEALAASEKRYGPDSFRTLSALMLTARALTALGREHDAITAAERGVRIAETALPRGDTTRIRARLQLGQSLADAEAARTSIDIALAEIAAAPERPLALEIDAHERLAAIAADAAAADSERGIAKRLAEELAAAEREELAALETWLSSGPAFR